MKARLFCTMTSFTKLEKAKSLFESIAESCFRAGFQTLTARSEPWVSMRSGSDSDREIDKRLASLSFAGHWLLGNGSRGSHVR